MEKSIKIEVDSEALDKAIEKAKRLNELLREAKQIADSLSGISLYNNQQKGG